MVNSLCGGREGNECSIPSESNGVIAYKQKALQRMTENGGEGDGVGAAFSFNKSMSWEAVLVLPLLFLHRFRFLFHHAWGSNIVLPCKEMESVFISSFDFNNSQLSNLKETRFGNTIVR